MLDEQNPFSVPPTIRREVAEFENKNIAPAPVASAAKALGYAAAAKKSSPQNLAAAAAASRREDSTTKECIYA